MRLTFLGHQGWMVESRDFRLLIDPILAPFFRNSPHSKVWVYPPRAVDVDRIGGVDAVYFTHEHEDHFHIESIDRLDRGTTMYLSGNMSYAAERILGDMGFETVRRVFATERVPFGSELVMTLFGPPAAGSERWVLQPLITGRGQGHSFFNPVDCPVSPELGDELRRRDVQELGLVCMANNMQVPRAPRMWTDLRQGRPPALGMQFEPARMLASHLSFGSLPPVRHFAIVGGGFIEETSPFGTFKCASQARLGELLREYSHGGTHIFGPEPGEWVDLDEPEPCLHPAEAGGPVVPSPEGEAALRKAEALARAFEEGTADRDYPPVTGRRALGEGEEAELTERLGDLARRLAATHFHVELVQQGHGGEQAPVPYREGRLMLRLRAEPEPLVFEYRPARCAFHRLERDPGDEALRRYPYGFECWASDLLGLMRGEVILYEIIKYRHRFWTPSRAYHGRPTFMGVLEDLFAPEVCPEATYALYRGAWERCRSRRAPSAGPDQLTMDN